MRQQIIVNSSGERIVTLILRHVGEWQHGNRCFERAAQVLFCEKEFVHNKIGKSKPKNQHDYAIYRAPFANPLLATGVPLHSCGRQLKRPGENNCDGEPNNQQHQNGFLKPGGKLKYRGDGRRNLQQQPCGGEVDDGDLKNAASLQFGEK